MAQTGSFITKLAQDYGQDAALEAVRSAVSNRPIEAAAYLKATCQRLKGERKDPITVPSTDTGADQFKAAMDERAATATKPPAAVLALATTRGMQYVEIALELGIGERTVRKYAGAIRRTLRAATMVQAAHIATKAGLL
jgi:DNA-binding NarL/FixJ family response regulator